MRILFYILGFLFIIDGYSQYSNVTRLWEEKETKADQLYDQKLYSKALDLYLEDKNNGGSSNELFLKIARCYYKLRDFSNALEYYEYPILRSSEESEYTPEDVYNYAETLVIAGRKDEAQLFYDEYYATSNDQKSINRMDGIFYYEDFFKDEGTVKVSKIDLGSTESEIAVVPYKEGLFFSANADFSWPIDNEYLMGELPTYGLYYTEYKKDSLKFKTPSLVDVNRQLFNITSPVILKDSIVIISANKKRIPIFNMEKFNYLKLYQATYERDFSWGKFEQMEINSQGTSIMTPSTNEFGDTLYFASDNPTGQGGFDIYYIFIKDGKWSSPINVGAPVNTSGDELYPFFKNGTLYFSSNGHPGIGGYDIYKLRNGARKVVNFGSPVNSQYDDFNLSFEPNKDNSGYFVSNREAFGVEGNDDIFKFISNRKERAFLQLQVSFQYDESPIKDAEIIVIDKNDITNREELKTDKNGIADLQVYLSDSYEVVVRKPPYFDYNNSFYIDQFNKIIKIELDRTFELDVQVKTSDDFQAIPNAWVLLSNLDDKIHEEFAANANGIVKLKAKAGANLILEINADENFNYLIDTLNIDEPRLIKTYYLERVKKMETITLSDILYEVDKYVLSDEHIPTLDTLARKMKEYPEIKVLIMAHTDSKGEKEYNFELSTKRAESVANYLIKEGITSDRIRYEGRGELEPLNNCIDGIECSEEDHMINRRTEIFVFYEE